MPWITCPHFLETFDCNWNPRLMLPSIVFSQFVKILPWCHHDFLQWRAAWFYSGNQLNMSTKKLKSWKKLIFAMEHERLNILPVISNVGIMKGLFELIDHWLLLQLLKCISSSAPGRKVRHDRDMYLTRGGDDTQHWQFESSLSSNWNNFLNL